MKVISVLACVVAMLLQPGFAAGKKQNDNGEVTLTVKATLTGTRTLKAHSSTGGNEPSVTDTSLSETCIATFTGSSTWKIVDWVPSECRHDCGVSITGNGSSREVTKSWCHCNTALHPTTDTKTASWTFKPSNDETTRELERILAAARGDIISPAGSVVINPSGIWFMSLSASTLAHEIVPEGASTHVFKGCRSSTNETTPVNAENPADAYAMYLIKSAYQAAFGPGNESLQQMTQGRWNLKDKGFTASGHFLKEGDQSPDPTTPEANANGSQRSWEESARWKAEVEWSIHYAMEPPEVEVTIEPGDDYDQWVPKGNMDDPGEPGAKHTFSITVHKRGEPNVGKKATLDFTIEKVSKELGVCMNWPDTNKARIAEGLRFRQQDYPGQSPMKVSGYLKASTTKPVGSIDLIVNSHDFGAWGHIKVSGKDEHDRSVVVTFKGRRNAPVPLPKDENNNHIADHWEDLHPAPSSDRASDEDNLPAGKGAAYKGDGLSLYEEYRGFRVKGAHTFGDPKRKDLFVCDDTDGSCAKGIDLFEQITDLKVHRVEKAELGTLRVINRNGTGDYHGVDQHGVLIIRGPDNSSPEAIAATSGAPVGPPKLTAHIKMPKDSPKGAKELNNHHALVAHELCHTVGISHHGEDINYAFWAWIQNADKPGTYELWEYDVDGDPDGGHKPAGTGRKIRAIYEADGTELKRGAPMPNGCEYSKRYGGHFLIATPKNGICSGNESCVIRYFDRQAYYSDKDPALRIIPDYSRNLTPDSLCDNAKGTGVNSPHNKPESRNGDATVGDCKGQIIVSDKY